MPVLIILVLLALVPLAEIALFIWIGEAIGVLPTLLLTVFAVILGAVLAWAQGFATLRAAKQSLDRGEVPVDHILSGAVLLIAAFFLMTPGFITAAIGFALLLPPVRLAAGRFVLNRLLDARDRATPGARRVIVLRPTRRTGGE